MEILQSSFFKGAFPTLRLEVAYSGHVTTDEQWHSQPLHTDVTRLYFVEKGSGVLLSDREQLTMRPGHVYLAPCGAPCGYYGTDTVTKLFFHVRLTTQNERDLFLGCHRLLELEMPVEQIRQMTAWYFAQDTLSQLQLKNAIFDTVCRFLRHPCCEWEEVKPLTPPVAAAVEYIHAHLRANLTVGEVAEACFVSSALLGRAFRCEMHVGVAQYIESRLMLEAGRLLLETSFSVGEISERLGYCDQFYFSRRFRNAFGQSPRTYRKSRSYT